MTMTEFRAQLRLNKSWAFNVSA